MQPAALVTTEAYGSQRADRAERENGVRQFIVARTIRLSHRLTSVGGQAMVARNRIHCSVVAVPVRMDGSMSSGALARDVLPWADPYVAQLIRKLQDEVRQERRTQVMVQRYRAGALDTCLVSTSGRISAVK
jgi:hypothetical protein